jgi:hypothetical protein
MDLVGDEEGVVPGFASAWKRCSASAAAVPSSSSEAFATGSPVRSMTIVWKLSSASSRPWEISGWYGVYWVYQPGFWKTFRRSPAGRRCPSSPAR